MKLNVITTVDKNKKEPEINIIVPELNIEVSSILQKINSVLNEKNQLIVYKDYNIFIINVNDIIQIFSKEKNNYCKTKDGIFKIKEPLYILEEVLPKDKFIRISNSTIININNIKCFNTSIIGKILVVLKDNEQLVVSKSKTKNIMNFFQERKYKNE